MLVTAGPYDLIYNALYLIKNVICRRKGGIWRKREGKRGRGRKWAVSS